MSYQRGIALSGSAEEAYCTCWCRCLSQMSLQAVFGATTEHNSKMGIESDSADATCRCEES